MRRIFNLTMGLLMGLLLLSSCKGETDVDTPTLELSTSTMTFAKEASEQILMVQTNRETWSAFSPQEGQWLTLKQEGSSLRVIAKSNTLGESRSTTIIVNADGLQRKVVVQQAASATFFELKEATILFPAEGGTRAISYMSNSEELKIELPTSASSWLTLREAVGGSFALVAEPNGDKASRSAKITLTSGTIARELEVIQQGTSPFILPLLVFPSRLYDVMSYEQSRGHFMLKAEDGGEDRPSLYRFLTKSDVVPFVQYEYHSSTSPSYFHAMMLYLDQSLVKDNADFDTYLKEQGLVKEPGTEGAPTALYKSVRDELPIQILVTFFSGGARLDFVYMPHQPEDYDTFASLPMTRMLPFLGNRQLKISGKKRAEVRAFELNEGNEPLEGMPDTYDLFEPKIPFDGEETRAYLYIVPSAENKIPEDDPYADVVSGVISFYKNLNLGVWDDRIDGNYYPTHKIFTLLTQAGYTYLGKLKDDGHAFYNRINRMAYILSIAEDEGAPLLEIMATYMRIDGDGTSIPHLLDHHRSMKSHRDDLGRLSRLRRQLHLRR